MTPAADGFRMPAEWTPHERTWMAWPGPNPTFDNPEDLAEARAAWAAVARAIRRFEPVTVVCGPGQSQAARALLGPDVGQAVERGLDDAWMVDIGPTFLTDGKGELAAVDWTFNGWGAQDWARWEHDAKIGAYVADLAGAKTYASKLVNEGGAIHVDGEGTVLLTETVQLGPERNPDWTREQVEAEIHAHLGTRKAIWLPRGLTGDYPRTASARSAMSTSWPPSPAPESWSRTPAGSGAPRPRGDQGGHRPAPGRDRRARAPSGGRRGPGPDDPAGRRPLGRLLLHQPLPLQRRGGPVRLRRPARRARGRRLSTALPRADGDTGGRTYDLCRRRWHPLHHPAAAEDLNQESHVAGDSTPRRKNAPPREDVLAAAMDMIAERGLEKLTMAALGREVGMSSGHLLDHFHSKDEWPLQTLEWSEGRLGAERGRLLAARGTARERLDAYVDLYVPDGHRDPHWTLWLEVWNRSQNADDAARERQVAIEGAWHRPGSCAARRGCSRAASSAGRPGPLRRPAAGPARRLLHPCGDRTARHGQRADPAPRKGVSGRIPELTVTRPNVMNAMNKT